MPLSNQERALRLVPAEKLQMGAKGKLNPQWYPISELFGKLEFREAQSAKEAQFQKRIQADLQRELEAYPWRRVQRIYPIPIDVERLFASDDISQENRPIAFQASTLIYAKENNTPEDGEVREEMNDNTAEHLPIPPAFHILDYILEKHKAETIRMFAHNSFEREPVGIEFIGNVGRFVYRSVQATKLVTVGMRTKLDYFLSEFLELKNAKANQELLKTKPVVNPSKVNLIVYINSHGQSSCTYEGSSEPLIYKKPKGNLLSVLAGAELGVINADTLEELQVAVLRMVDRQQSTRGYYDMKDLKELQKFLHYDRVRQASNLTKRSSNKQRSSVDEAFYHTTGYSRVAHDAVDKKYFRDTRFGKAVTVLYSDIPGLPDELGGVKSDRDWFIEIFDSLPDARKDEIGMPYITRFELLDFFYKFGPLNLVLIDTSCNVLSPTKKMTARENRSTRRGQVSAGVLGGGWTRKRH